MPVNSTHRGWGGGSEDEVLAVKSKRTFVKAGTGMRVCSSSAEGRGGDKRIPGAHWTARLANQGAPCLMSTSEKVRWRVAYRDS